MYVSFSIGKRGTCEIKPDVQHGVRSVMLTETTDVLAPILQLMASDDDWRAIALSILNAIEVVDQAEAAE
jgi:hypothetical protein